MVCGYCNDDKECRVYGLKYSAGALPIIVHDKINVCASCEGAFRKQLGRYPDEVALEEVQEKQMEIVRPNIFGV